QDKFPLPCTDVGRSRINSKHRIFVVIEYRDAVVVDDHEAANFGHCWRHEPGQRKRCLRSCGPGRNGSFDNVVERIASLYEPNDAAAVAEPADPALVMI